MLVGGIAFAAFFVTPVGGDTEFVELVHIEGADLHFHTFVFGTDDDGVQTFIAVAFRVGDVVVELAGDRLPKAVDNAQRGVTLGDGINQNPHGADVKEAVEAEFFLHHFFVNGVDVFRAVGDFKVDIVFLSSVRRILRKFSMYSRRSVRFSSKSRAISRYFPALDDGSPNLRAAI